MGRLLRPANEGGFGDILKNKPKDNKPSPPERNPSATLYYTHFGFSSLIDDLSIWYVWNFDPNKGIYRDTITKTFEAWELHLSPLRYILNMVREKQIWDDMQITNAKRKADDYNRAIKRMMDKKK